MEDASIHDNDIAFIKKDYDFIDGNIYAVRITDESEAVLKKVNIKDSTIILSPCNKDYEPIIEDVDNVSIIGECVGSYHAR